MYTDWASTHGDSIKDVPHRYGMRIQSHLNAANKINLQLGNYCYPDNFTLTNSSIALGESKPTLSVHYSPQHILQHRWGVIGKLQKEIDRLDSVMDTSSRDSGISNDKRKKKAEQLSDVFGVLYDSTTRAQEDFFRVATHKDPTLQHSLGTGGDVLPDVPQ